MPTSPELTSSTATKIVTTNGSLLIWWIRWDSCGFSNRYRESKVQVLRIRLSGVGRFGHPRISADCPWTTFMDDHVVHGRLNWSKVVLLSMNVFPSFGMILGPTCSVGSGRAIWTNWRWIIFYFSISCPFVQRVVQDIVVIFTKFHFFVRHVLRSCWLANHVDPVSQRNCHVSISEWRASFHWSCCWGL